MEFPARTLNDRLTLECQEHRKTLENVLNHLMYAKRDLKKNIEYAEDCEKVEGNDSSDRYWQLAARNADKICNYNELIKELQLLILTKIKIITNHTT